MQQIETMFDPFAGPAIERSVATTPPQREIWASSLMGADASVAYNEAILLRMRGTLDVPALQAAITALVVRHESLHAVFSPDGLSMLITEPTAPMIGWHDWSNGALTDSERRLAGLRDAVVTSPFDIEQGPLVRFELVALAPDNHALIICAHHVMCDGWSFGVLVQDLSKLYNAQRQQRDAHLPQAELFSEYAAWLNSDEVLDAAADDEAYWFAQYSSVPDPLELPSDRNRPSRRSYGSHRTDLTLSKELTASLKQLGATNGCSLFVTMLAGYSALLSRLSEQDDLVVGVASAGQALAGRDQLVGHCVNTLPIRLRPAAAQSFAEWLQDVRGVSLDAFEHQALGLGKLLERIALRRSPKHAPLASIMFNLDRALPASSLAFEGLDVTMQAVPRRAENFEMFLNIVESVEGLILECQYNTDLFDQTTIQRWLGSYEALLRAAVTDSGTALSKLPILTDADRAIYADCNNSARVWTSASVIHELIEARVSLHPDPIAIEQQNTALSYGELNQRANQLAHHLRTLGIGRGAFVGVAVARTPNILVAVLGVLKAGAAYVPLDTWLPEARLSGMAADANLSALVTEDAVSAAFGIPSVLTVSLDGDAPILAAASTENLPSSEQSARPEDPAYVIFTSGSTGKPKGVVVPHSAVVNLLSSLRELPGMTSNDVVLAVTTLGFDVSVSELLFPLTVGARIVIATRETSSDGAELRELVESSEVNFICATPATYRLLLAEGWTGNSNLRVICTGEAMPRELAAILVNCAREVWNGYGPTETTVWSTFFRVQSPVERVLIGRPVANTLISIRDKNGEDVPVGVPGEMFIGGAGVATGYLNRPELTTERFTFDAHIPGVRWYRTGDLVRLLPNGELECLGRADDQVKIRGIRIEPGEIAVAVSSWPGVKQATVIARQDQEYDVRLVAYVVADEHTQFGDAFRSHLKVSLPDYMVPSAVVRMSAMPLNASGKIDRKRLSAPDESSVVATEVYVAPRTETEKILASLWQQALSIARIGVRDDFFALGGHSLLASQILARLRSDHGIQLTFRRIFESPTIEALALIIDSESSSAKANQRYDRIDHRSGMSSAPLSALQERIWLLNELDPDSQVAYNNAASWMLTGDLNEAALDEAIHDVVRQHSILRTSFHIKDGERIQTVHEQVSIDMQRVDLRLVPRDQRDAAIDSYFITQQKVPFSIGVAPLFRVSLLTLSSDQHLLYTLQNGMIWDGWSFDIFLRELAKRYEGITSGNKVSVSPQHVNYGDFASWQRAWLASPEAEQQRAWWGKHLEGEHETLRLPSDFSEKTGRSVDGSHVALNFNSQELASFQSLARQHDSTLYMVMLAAYSVWLHIICDQQTLHVATPMRARIRPELENLLGPFVNTVVLRMDIQAGATFADVLKRVRNDTLDALSNQTLPFEQLGIQLPPIRALFSLQDARERPLTMGSLGIEQRHVPTDFVTNDLTMWMMQYPDRLLTVLNFSSALLKPESAKEFLSLFRTLVWSLLEAPNRAISEIELVPPEERAAQLQLRNVSNEKVALDLIANIAQESPASVAITYQSTRITYRELWRRAGCVASALKQQGLGTASVVALDLPVGVDHAIASLGVLRAGATVLFLNDDDAAEYSSRLVTDASAQLRVVRRAGNTASQAVATLAELEAKGATTELVTSTADGSMLFGVPDTNRAISWTRHSLADASAQARAIVGALGLNTTSKIVLAMPSGLDGWMQSLLAVLSSGASVRLVDSDVLSSSAELEDEVEASGGTIFIGIASSWRSTLDASWNSQPFDSGLLIGDGLEASELRAIAKRDAKFAKSFGSPEIGSVAAIQTMLPSNENVRVDRVVDGVDIRVFDRRGRPLPAGVAGSLWAARASSAAHKWIRLDVHGRRDTQGAIQLSGNAASQPTLDGSNVNAAVIESEMRQLPTFAQSAVALHRDRQGKRVLVAYAERSASADSAGATLQSQLKARLPFAWLPKRTVFVEKLPRIPNGEVNRRALVSPFENAGQHVQLAATTPDEKMLAQVWTEVLGAPTINRTDNFFQLGGTSLMCFQVVELVRARTKLRLSPRILLLGTLADAGSALELARNNSST